MGREGEPGPPASPIGGQLATAAHTAVQPPLRPARLPPRGTPLCLLSSSAAPSSLKRDLPISSSREGEKTARGGPWGFRFLPTAQHLNFSEHPSIMQPLTCPRKASKLPAWPCGLDAHVLVEPGLPPSPRMVSPLPGPCHLPC